MLPAWQALAAGTQEAPAAQALQDPVRHTWLVPQLVPSATSCPVSTHTDRPVAQLVAPPWQGKPPGVQAVPGWQAPHTPREQ